MSTYVTSKLDAKHGTYSMQNVIAHKHDARNNMHIQTRGKTLYKVDANYFRHKNDAKHKCEFKLDAKNVTKSMQNYFNSQTRSKQHKYIQTRRKLRDSMQLYGTICQLDANNTSTYEPDANTIERVQRS